MYNLMIALAIGAVAWAILPAAGVIGWVESIGLGVIAFGAAYFLLARRMAKRLEAIMAEVNADAMAQRFDKAVQRLEEALQLAPWQFLLASQMHAQIGTILYVRGKTDEARPHLEKAFFKHWVARAMLAADRFQQKDYDRAWQLFEKALTSNNKEGLLYSAYAWCLWKHNDLDKAIEVLARGEKALPSDEKIKANLNALRNGKKMKMQAYAENWYQFMLERPKAQTMAPPPHMKGMFRGARRGR